MLPSSLLAGALLLAAAAMAVPATAAGTDLDRYRWTSRVLVIAAEAGDPRAAAQEAIVAAAASGMGERDLVVVRAIGEGREAASLRRRLGLPATGFRAVLVGKDGGAKLEAAEPIPAQTLFSTIDAMPMRREESAGRRN
ncbi:DUF4174 domain-containing protein [Methylobacterium platani]|uniref:DUF4174 domain-containing protein n=2 Tax=Methylobacterium platani TaxID=427683 RepID=A0A179S320_9HYPH|nr:DUF4174 domain-containing protein [Methylobacterium platani]KMO19588.1 hypothetical protein SQ03_07535 [Methylobacterium platani JCM 14648]OAS20078.1 hypothetical protein A5481_23525 [Methylobacterium platani]